MPRERITFTAPERAFIISMVHAGIAASWGWLSPEQLTMAANLASRLAALPLARPQREGAAPGRRRRQERALSASDTGRRESRTGVTYPVPSADAKARELDGLGVGVKASDFHEGDPLPLDDPRLASPAELDFATRRAEGMEPRALEAE